MSSDCTIAARHCPQARPSRFTRFARTVCIGLVSVSVMPSVAAATGRTEACNAALQYGSPLGHWDLSLGSDRTSTLVLTLPANRNVLWVARETGVDVDLEVSSANTVELRVGNPVRRYGVLRGIWRSDASGRAMIRVRATADGGPGSRVVLQAFSSEALQPDPCQAVVQALVAGDTDFARARLISAGRAGPNAGSAGDLYARAFQDYERAFMGLAPANIAIRAEVAHAIATLLCDDTERWREAERWSTLAARLFQNQGNSMGRASAESLQAITWMQLAQLPDAASAADPIRRDSRTHMINALHQLLRLAAFYERRRERFDAATQLNLAGLTLFNMGKYDSALASYRHSQALYEGSGERYHLALVLQNIALVDWDLGRSSAALNGFRRALDLVSVADSPDLYALILNNLALANRTVGRLDSALELHARALDASSQIQDNGERGRSLFGIGMVYSAVGDRRLAADFLHQALDLSVREGEGRDQVSALRALAMIEAQDGHHEEAIRLDREALVHATGPIVRAHLLVQIADSESLLGRNQAAATDLALARNIPQADDVVSRALVQFQGGVLNYRAGRLPVARSQLRAALSTYRAFGLDAAAFDADVALARVDMAAGDLKQADRHLSAGLELSEMLRVQVADPELRATSMQPLRPAFDLKVDLLARAHQKAVTAGDLKGAERAAHAALTVAERSRARVMRDIALADYTHQTEARVERLLRHKSELLADIAAHEDRLEANGIPSTTDARVAEIRADVARLRQQLAVLDSQLATLSRSARAASSDQTGVLKLPPDVAVISYWLGASDAYAWLQTQSHVWFVNLGSAEALRAAAEAAHLAYRNVSGASMEERLRSGESLSRLALQPLLLEVPAGVTRLIIVPDGPMHYVSFAALPMRPDAGDSFLIGKYEVAYGSSIAAVQAMARPRPAEGMLLVADAVYGADDPRLVHTLGQRPALMADVPRLRSAVNMAALERLPATAAEASRIAQLASPLPVDYLEGFAATREAVLSRPLERYRYIHFAVHATTDSEIPQLSSLVLSTYNADGRPHEDRIWAGDLMGRRFNARTVVLSACDTALGRDIGGDGLFSLRYVVLARGAQSVVASLWAVPDRSTATLMQSFYRGLLQENRRPESALTLAMREMLDQGTRDPALWAPFTATITSLQ